MSYRQLTWEQRYQIWALLKIGTKRSEIAKEIGVHKSTVSRELTRNESGRWKYNPSRAMRMAHERHEDKRKHRIDGQTWAMVERLLGLEWSPEQISKRLKIEGLRSVSHQTIYCHIYQNRLEGGNLYVYLRRRHKYRKRIHKYCSRKGWDTRRPISERPAIVELRSRLGDWEADTIIGREKKGGILSLVVGWEGVKELDLVKGGDPHPLPFDAEACAEWLADRPDLFAEIADAVVKGFEAHIKRLDDALKN